MTRVDQDETIGSRGAVAEASANAAAPLLALSGIEHRFGRVTALAGIDLAVRAGEFVTLLGPAGAGKTTLLRVVAGELRVDRGQMTLTLSFTQAAPLDRKAPRSRNSAGMVMLDRRTGMPVSSAAKRGFFGGRRVMRGWHPKEIAALKLVGLSGYEGRTLGTLSPIQQLRAALGHVLAPDPALLLLDECFAVLGPRERAGMQKEVRQLQRRLGIATLFATEDFEAALRVSDRIAVMTEGRIVQIGTPEEIYRGPKSRFVAELVGEANIFRGRAGVISGATVEVKLENGAPMRATLAPGDRSVHYGADLALVVRPERPRRLDALRPIGEAAENRVAGTLVDSTYLGDSVRHRVALDGGGEIILRWPAEGEMPAKGTRLALGWSAADMTAVLWT